MEYTMPEAKNWAKEHFKGIEGLIMPSFTPDFTKLDEEGIRYDVQHAIDQGYFSLCCILEATAMTNEERGRFTEIVCDEAKSKILVSLGLLPESVEQGLQQIKHFESVGGTHVLLGYPVGFDFTSEEDIFQYTKMICGATNLLINIYAQPMWGFARFHPSAFNPRLLDRMADIDNVVAMTTPASNMPSFAEYQHLMGDKLLIQSPSHSSWPVTIPKYGQQWGGALMHDILQTPENRRLIRMFNLFVQGEFEDAMDIYWELTPLFDVQAAQMPRYSGAGLHPFILWKYYQWLTGGNGGMLRTPVHRMNQGDKDAVRRALKATGINPREPEEEFYVGRVNYGKGARLKL